jgi:hypothetical protein
MYRNWALLVYEAVNTNVSGQPIVPIFKGSTLEGCPWVNLLMIGLIIEIKVNLVTVHICCTASSTKKKKQMHLY